MGEEVYRFCFFYRPDQRTGTKNPETADGIAAVPDWQQLCRDDYQTKRLLSLVSALPEHFDPEIFQEIVEQVIVSDASLMFQLKNGLRLEETREG